MYTRRCYKTYLKICALSKNIIISTVGIKFIIIIHNVGDHIGKGAVKSDSTNTKKWEGPT